MAKQSNPGEPVQQPPYERLLLAYAKVFGLSDEKRNEAQKLVWEDMQKRGYFLRSTAVPIDGGGVLTNKMEIAEGMRVFFLDTLERLRQAGELGQDKPKPKVIK